MEGLMLARVLRDLAPHLPARTLGWVFPDETTAAVLLDGTTNLVLSYRPPSPALYLTRERLAGEPRNAFQRTLAARARGDLVLAEQLKLDRVATLTFTGERGFVDVPSTRLLFELTGRNANVLLLAPGEGWEGTIVAAAREITSSRNRFRNVRTGGTYTPPPPYDKLDPRNLDAASPETLAALAELPLSRWRDRVDGLGLSLSAELARRAGIPAGEAPGERMEVALAALRDLARDPTVREGTLQQGVRDAVRSEKAETLRRTLREPLLKRRTLLLNQLGDVERAMRAYEEAQTERRQADLLMAYGADVAVGATEAQLTDFDGETTVTVPLEPQLTPVQNAEKLYVRARRREAVFDRLAEREPALQAELAELDAELAGLAEAGLPTLEALERGLDTARVARSPYGMRFVSPSGYEVLVGRNNKENALLTHRVGRSMDWWFHAQGYPGSHVLVRAQGRDLALPDILMAASVAAYHSKARASGNVAVDYTRVKHVWRPRGAPAGQVHYTQQKTVFVDPALPEA